MPHRVAIVGALFLSGAGGCASSAHDPELKRLSDAVLALQKDVSRQDSRIEELSNRMFVISDRVETPAAAVEPTPSPPELKIVRLVPEVATEDDGGGAAGPDDSGPTVVIKLNADGEPAALPVVSVPPAPKLGDRGDADKLFGAALAAYREGQVEEAHQRFAAFLKKFPGHAYADNAVYWMGECRFDAHEYRKAVLEFTRVIKKFPRSNKVPDALFKMGIAYERLGEQAKARQVFDAILMTYPKSALAELARHHLTALASAAKGPVPQEGSSR